MNWAEISRQLNVRAKLAPQPRPTTTTAPEPTYVSVEPSLDGPGYPLGEPSRVWGGDVPGNACLTARLLESVLEEARKQIRSQWIEERRKYIGASGST